MAPNSSPTSLPLASQGPTAKLPLRRHYLPFTWQRFVARTLRYDWSAAGALTLLDIMAWLLISNVLGFWRHDQIYHLGPTTLKTQLLALGILLTTIFVIGGYDRRSVMTSLAYTSEYLIGMVAATALASLIIYAVSTYSLSMHPSRAVVLASFALFAADLARLPARDLPRDCRQP